MHILQGCTCMVLDDLESSSKTRFGGRKRITVKVNLPLNAVPYCCDLPGWKTVSEM